MFSRDTINLLLLHNNQLKFLLADKNCIDLEEAFEVLVFDAPGVHEQVGPLEHEHNIEVEQDHSDDDFELADRVLVLD